MNINHTYKIRLSSTTASILILAIGLQLSSCRKEAASVAEQKNILISKKIETRIQEHKRKKIDKCKNSTFERAEKYVHEKMIKEFSFLMKDTITFPEKPIRPPLPENLHLDTIGVKKIGTFKLKK